MGSKRLAIEYFQETFGEGSGIERWFRELKERTRRLYNNTNSNKVKSIEEIASAIALTQHTTQHPNGTKCNTWLTVPWPLCPFWATGPV
ncbi:MAG: hypothetical protein QW470_02045 [Candidatus Caldarchaeum sp.]